MLLNHYLRIIEAWAYKWRMSFNLYPMEQAVENIFSRKHATLNHPAIYVNDTQVTRSNEHKYLSIVLDSKLSFFCYIQSAISEARQSVRMSNFMFRYVPRKELNTLYKLYVHPHVDYDDVIYQIPLKKCDLTSSINLNHHKVKLESLQYSAE